MLHLLMLARSSPCIDGPSFESIALSTFDVSAGLDICTVMPLAPMGLASILFRSERCVVASCLDVDQSNNQHSQECDVLPPRAI